MRSCIGRGQFGEVWRAEAPGGIDVAIKIIFRPLHHASAKRELDALEAIKSLRHPFLLRTQAYWSLADQLLIAMELADGNLEDRCTECRKAGLPGIPMDELLRYFAEASEALDYLHSKHVTHRDVKPDNILLVERHAKLADFGLARVLGDEHVLKTSMTMGTPAFMAPEVWQGHYSVHSDQYSLAATFAYLRLNRTLFAGDLARLMLDCLAKVPNLDPLPEAEQKVLHKAFAKKPEERFSNCMQFFEALLNAVEGHKRPSGISVGTGNLPEQASAPDHPPTPAPQPITASRSAPTTVEIGKDVSAGPASLRTTDGTSDQTSTDKRAQDVFPGATPSAKWRPAPAPGKNQRRRAPLRVGLLLLLLVIAGMFAAYFFWPGLHFLSSHHRPDDGGPGVVSPLPVDFLPALYEPDEGAKVVQVEKLRVYDRIRRALPGGASVVLLLIRPEDPKDPPAFYIMRDKVCNAVFQAFADARPDLVKGSQWMDGARVEINADTGEVRKLGNKDRRLPVFRVSVDEAHQCALWLGGDLPTTRQWLTAAGLHVPGFKGPFKGNVDDLKPEEDEIALKRAAKGPMPVGTAANDVSPRGCRDMAGNGKEWTRTKADKVNPEEDDQPLSFPPRKEHEIWLLGQTYEASKPMLFHDDSAYFVRHGDPPSRFPYVSFRIVIEIPGPQ